MSLKGVGPPPAPSAGAAAAIAKKIPTVASGYDIERNGSKDNASINQPTKFIRSDMADVPAQQAAGSTLPLVISRKKGGAEDASGDYNPFEHRNVEHPTSDFETLIHFLKGVLGSGILAMPMAFMTAGLYFGIGATIIVGILVTYCVHILVKSAHILMHRRKIPVMTFADVAEQAFLGSPGLIRWSGFMRFVVNALLLMNLLGTCCIYMIFVGTQIKQIVDYYDGYDLSLRLWILLFTVPLIFMNLVRNLKFLTPFSFIANALMFVGIVITFTYILKDIPRSTELTKVASVLEWPLFFGTVIFALEGIAVIMSLENEMKQPKHFIGCPSVLNIGMGLVIVLYIVLGFFGYLKYGSNTEGSITLNLPVEEKLAQSVKVMIAIAMFFSFTLHFYVLFSIIWRRVKDSIAENKRTFTEYCLRIVLVIMCGVIAFALPNLGPFISLIGAVCLSTLGLMVPAIIELAVYYESPGFGCLDWIMWKDIFLIIFGFVGFLTGTYVSILEFIEEEP
ncbi:proton-coupled amino acid transporter-like protein pathetic isoform X3 [Teleopsis dalmanni]|uniref:proton-coupled amino acid transporter-like protein pathetic isoform X3 n=1 Tax=Teleopsis dalmanni TaxID=139649 RepID=UPI0018CF05BD|nr:proton-coupled amino acid transporter-like protein pathetic isoform X3 [Teleopsis dalmanni]